MPYSRAKRAFDCLGAGLGLLVCAPLLLLTAGLVLAFHGAPVIFAQERVTQGGRIFRLRKFRSMRPLDPARGWTSDATRLTAFGRLLRATSIDELPSLWNVLVGDMSLIGPRPLTTDYLALYTPEQSRRHAVRGGLSGLAQVSGRNALSWDERFDLDLEYVETMSLRTDLRILARTVGTVLRRTGVSHPGAATTFSYGGSLRSDLIEFEQIARTRDLTQWMARTRAGQRVGLCEMGSLGESARLIRFLPHPADAAFDPDEHEMLAREVLRLLLNRARGTDADFAFCPVATAGAAADLYRSCGFHPVTEAPALTALPQPAAVAAGGELLCCALWPETAPNPDLRMAS
ncbi:MULTISPECIES: sugar transferase [unclassified Brevibacterium]|uniref:sugar transferase n=1 Tax=unclassified Brevibacterium TaxID=2614124 RepID=UPI0010F93235|nr:MULTISPECIES: sugar transferase [unclassified Brevibacterium]MCM1011151.1 sugar transferase [Brevibacterium sp. XM4083]